MIIRLWRHIFISVQGRYEKSFNILHWSHHSLIQQLHLRLISLWWTLYMVPWWLDLWTGLGVLPLPPSHNWSLTRIQPSLSFPLCKNNATKIKCVCIIQGQGPEPIRVRVPSSWKTWSPEQISNLVPSRIFQTNPIVLHKQYRTRPSKQCEFCNYLFD